MKKIIGILIIAVFILSAIIFGMNIFEGKDTATITVEQAEIDSVAVGEEFTLPTYSAVDGRGEDISDKIKILFKTEDGTKLVGALEPILNKDQVKFTYVGNYTITFCINDEEGNPLDSKAINVKVSKNSKIKTEGLAICMYHYVYDPVKKPSDLNNNYISTTDLKAELDYLNKEKYYYPNWNEVREYVDGKLVLPEKSIVLTFDDGAKSFLELGLPIFEEHKIPVTSFLITSKDGEKKVAKYKSDYISFQSHSDNMHRPGGNIGHGGVFTALSKKDAVDDLTKSTKICGNGEAFAYPFGDYTDQCVEAVEEAGFKCAVTTNYGKVMPGDNPLLLNRVRMFEGQSLDSFAGSI